MQQMHATMLQIQAMLVEITFEANNRRPKIAATRAGGMARSTLVAKQNSQNYTNSSYIDTSTIKISKPPYSYFPNSCKIPVAIHNPSPSTDSQNPLSSPVSSINPITIMQSTSSSQHPDSNLTTKVDPSSLTWQPVKTSTEKIILEQEPEQGEEEGTAVIEAME